MKKFHLIFGAIVLVVFLLTGQYPDRFHEHLRHTPDGPRMLYRTRHIFILTSGVLHLGIGSYFSYRAGGLLHVVSGVKDNPQITQMKNSRD